MSILDLLYILRARKNVLMLTMLLTVAAGLVIGFLLGASYRATTSVVVNYLRQDAVSGETAPQQQQAAVIATQSDIIKSYGAALRVVDRLKLADDPTVKAEFSAERDQTDDIRSWAATQLLRRLEVVPAKESSVINISFKGSAPESAVAAVSAFVAEYLDTSIRMKENPLQQASTYFDDQLKSLRLNLETAQKRLSQYQQEKGIVDLENRLDVESARLNDLSSELVAVQSKLSAAQAHRRNAEGTGGKNSPQLTADPIVKELKASLVKAQVALGLAERTFMPDHPNYQKAAAEVSMLRSALDGAMKATLNSVRNEAAILQQHEAELSASLTAQRNKVLELNRARDQLTILEKDAESARQVYDTALQRYYQTRLAGHANQTDVFVLNPSQPSVKRATPGMAVIVGFSLFLGVLLGTGLCLLLEAMFPRIRSSRDILRILDVPLLGEVNLMVPKAAYQLLK